MVTALFFVYIFPMINSVGIIGLGAVGAVVGQQLKEVLGNKLFCIVDDERKNRYIKNGISINNEVVDFNYVTPSELKPVDLIIIGTKNLQLKEALASIKNGVGPDTMILSLLNGIQSESDITELYGAEKTLYGFIIDLQSINLSGKITCFGKGTIVFGEKDNSKSQRVQSVAELFDAAKVSYKIPENIQLEMWKKYLINVTFNSLGAICRSTYGGFGYDCLQSAARKIGHEVIAIANAEGIALTKEMLEDDIKKNLSYDPQGKCSMLQDIEAGRLTENDYFCGTICRLGKKHGIETPYCQFLGELISGTEKARQLREEGKK